MAEERFWTIRYRNVPGSLIAVVNDSDIEIEEICAVCKRQGAIYCIHPDTEDHKGSQTFRAASERSRGT